MSPRQTPAPDAPETPRQAAARWFARRRSGAMSAQELRELEVWLAQDTAHRQAYERLARLWAGAEGARNDPEVMQLREGAARAQALRRWRTAGLAAASLLAVCLVGGGLANWMTAGRDASPALVAAGEHQEFRTSIGQTATVTLVDGSVVTLDTDTVLRTRTTWNRRYAELERGRAFFRVAKNPVRPFVVLAGGKTVTALGTSFEVLVEPGRFEVTLVSGRVRVEQPKAPSAEEPAAKLRPTVMEPGARLVGEGDHDWRLSEVNVENETSWVGGLLRFRDAPLGEVAAELNRYSRKKVVIPDPAVAARPIQGAFAAGDVEEFVKAVEAYKLARVVSQTSGEIVLAAPQTQVAEGPPAP